MVNNSGQSQPDSSDHSSINDIVSDRKSSEPTIACLHCEYPLVGLTTTTCPECGKASPSEFANLPSEQLLPWERSLRRSAFNRLIRFLIWCAFRFPTFLRVMRNRLDRPILQSRKLLVGILGLVVITPAMIHLVDTFAFPVFRYLLDRPHLMVRWWTKSSLSLFWGSVDWNFVLATYTVSDIVILSVVIIAWCRFTGKESPASSIIILVAVGMYFAETLYSFTSSFLSISMFSLPSKTIEPYHRANGVLRFYFAAPLLVALLLRVVWRERYLRLLVPVALSSLTTWLMGKALMAAFRYWVLWRFAQISQQISQ